VVPAAFTSRLRCRSKVRAGEQRGALRVNIYLACTVRGNRGGIAGAREIAALLERCGHRVLTAHLLDDNVDEAESALTEREVYDRDLEWLNTADLLIAEASGSSYGVGYEVGYVLGRAPQTGQRVMLLYDAARAPHISRLISGNTHPSCTTHGYTDSAGLLQFVAAHLQPVDASHETKEPLLSTVWIRRLNDSVELPRYESEGAAAFDLAASEDVVIEPGEVALVPTGLVVEVPAGMFLAILARSSTPLKRGLMVANGVGIVDSDYCGAEDEVKIAVLNFRNVAAQVRAGDRIAQGMILAAPRVVWMETRVVAGASRGGFGSTG
jgi:dUTP pyrophosphatase